jgi:hypothetical protein
LDVGGGFTQRTCRKESAIPEGTVGVQKGEIQVPVEFQMLKPVVEDENVGSIGLDGSLTRSPPFPSHPDGHRTGLCCQEDRLITEARHVQGFSPRSTDPDHAAGLSSVSPAEDSGAQTFAMEVPGKPQGKGSLSCPANHDIAHADHKGGQIPPMLSRPVLVMLKAAGIGSGHELQQGGKRSQRPGWFPGVPEPLERFCKGPSEVGSP